MSEQCLWKRSKNRRRYNGINSKLERAFYNDSDPAYLRARELPRDRVMVYMAAQGKSNKEIAELFGVIPSTVANTLKQPWARQLMQVEQEAVGVDALTDLIKQHGKGAFLNIVKLGEDPDAPANVRLEANKVVLDRLLGKPNTPIEVTNKKPAAEKTREELEQSVANIAARLGGLEGVPSADEDKA
jgi:hypothetical protein